MNTKWLKWTDKRDSELIITILLSHGIIMGESDTVCGLLSSATKAGKYALDSIKKRKKKPYLLLISSKEKLTDLVSLQQLSYIDKWIDFCWPGPLTIILKTKPDVPRWLQSEKGTIAVRVPNHSGIQAVLKEIPFLFSTSANRADRPVPESVELIDPVIKKQVAAIVCNGNRSIVPSTILDCTDRIPRVIREGAYSITVLESITGMRFMR